MGNLQLFHYKYCEESKQFKKSETNNTIHYIKELLYIIEYLKDSSIEYKVDGNENVLLL